MTAAAPELTKSEAYDVTGQMILDRMDISRTTLKAYKNKGLLPAGRRRDGVRGLFYTAAQANRLMRLTGCQAERFSESDS